MKLDSFQRRIVVVIITVWVVSIGLLVADTDIPAVALITIQGALMLALGAVFGVGLARKENDDP